ncbi:hypothetical protein DPEC_G00302690 [Dallia pectoralis]|uniref:Uncharacterized protein n=1 Tax=Dallia pectoralis TaxID=75939 RepID=A0ACC2FH25_DALPE|nr:hypothetical protein DPEC_G00302690 [Dallia pectoralis]
MCFLNTVLEPVQRVTHSYTYHTKSHQAVHLSSGRSTEPTVQLKENLKHEQLQNLPPATHLPSDRPRFTHLQCCGSKLTYNHHYSKCFRKHNLR